MVIKNKKMELFVPALDEINFETTESFEKMFSESSAAEGKMQGKVVKGIVSKVEDDYITVDAGMKSEGRVARREFGKDDVKVGDIVEIFVEKYETRDGSSVLSREKARKEEVWLKLEKLHNEDAIVNGSILERVKGGFSVDVDGVLGFMPGSQIDVRPVKDLNAMVGQNIDVKILKMDRVRSNIIVSHRAIKEGEINNKREEIMKTIKEGDVLDGIVKNITEYGVFVDLGGIDGLLHITDISWKRVVDPRSILSFGQSIKVKVISFDPSTQRISLGMKQLEKDPWDSLESSLKVGQIYKGTVNSIADYGAFVELENGIEGLIHNSELSWVNKNIHPNKVLNIGDTVDVMLLEIDNEKHRLSLGYKQTTENPWETYAKNHKVGDIVEGEIKNVTEFGLFISLDDELSGMAHMSDLSWDKSGEEAIKEYSKGQKVKSKILDISVEKERVVLGVKQIEKDGPSSAVASSDIKKGEVVTCEIKDITDRELIVDVNGAEGIIKKLDLSTEKSEQRLDRFAKGERVDAKIMTVGRNGVLTLSIKAMQFDEEKKVMKEYGSTETGAVLGDILGVAMDEAKEKAEKK